MMLGPRISLVAAAMVGHAAWADVNVSGFAEALYAGRTSHHDSCQGVVKACPEVANEQRLRVLVEGRQESMAATLRADLWNDLALSKTRGEINEAYVEAWTKANTSLRVGRQVVTWGTGEYLYVNDMFPKNYDRFFRGHPFDALKDAVDGVKASWSAQPGDLEVVVSRPRADQMPDGHRYVGASAMPMDDLPQNRSGADVAARLSTRLSNFDVAGYAGHYRDRTQSVTPSSTGMVREGAQVSHVGLSATGNLAAGVAWAEVAQLYVDLLDGNVNRFATGSRFKVLLGYSRELASDVTFTAQLQAEHDTNHGDYIRSLQPGVHPLKRDRALAHARIQARLMNQTLGLGIQGFVTNEGDTHINPFVNYTPLDGLNVELGANVFNGRADTQYGALSDDSNVYLSARYSY
jgi:hypothetical protein